MSKKQDFAERETYSQKFGRLAKWAAGHRVLHDLVIHPLLAVSNYWDPVVKLHDYHGFSFSEPGEPGAVGITGSREDVEAVLRALGREDAVEHCHTDGVLCYGIVHYDPDDEEDDDEEDEIDPKTRWPWPSNPDGEPPGIVDY